MRLREGRVVGVRFSGDPGAKVPRWLIDSLKVGFSIGNLLEICEDQLSQIVEWLMSCEWCQVVNGLGVDRSKLIKARDWVVDQVYWIDFKLVKVWSSFDAYHCCRVPQDSNCSLSASFRHDLDWLHWIVWVWIQGVSLLVAMTYPHEISTFCLFLETWEVFI